MLVERKVTANDLKGYIYWWNNKYPFDRWWREKHNIAFNSQQHQEACLIDQRLEYEEYLLFSQIAKIKALRDREIEEADVTGRFLRKQTEHMNQDVVDEMFDNFDFDKYYDKDAIVEQEDVDHE